MTFKLGMNIVYANRTEEYIKRLHGLGKNQCLVFFDKRKYP